MLNHEYPPHGGGSGVATRSLAQALHRLGHRVCVLTTAAGPDERVEGGVRVRRFSVALRSGRLAGPRTWLSFLRRAPEALERAIADLRPQVIHSHFLFPAAWVVTRTDPAIPHVASTVGAEVHDPSRLVSADRNPLMRAAVRRVVRRAEVITSSASDLTARLAALFPERTRITEVPWPVPPLPAGDLDRRDLGLGNDRFVIATLGRLVRRKRIDVLLRAVARIADPRIAVVVMGAGPRERRLRSLVAELGVADAVRFAGRVGEDEKAAYLRAADLFCLPSDHEGFGLALVEAMGLGTPAVVTAVGGQTDIVTDGVDGRVVPPGDPESLARAIVGLAGDAESLADLGRGAARRALDFVPERVAPKFVEAYEEAMAGRPGDGREPEPTKRGWNEK